MAVGMGIPPGLAATGYGMETLFGTPEQQRTREQQLLLQGNNLALQRDQLAEQKREHDLQYELIDYTDDVNSVKAQLGLPLDKPGTHKYPRNAGNRIANLLTATVAAARTKPGTTLQEALDEARAFGVDMPGLPTQESIKGIQPEDIGQTMTIPRPENAAKLARPLSPGGEATLREVIQARANAAKQQPIQHFPPGSMVSDPTAPGGYRQVGEAPEKPVKETNISEEQAYAKAMLTPDQERTPEQRALIKDYQRRHPGPDQNASALARLRLEKAQAEKDAENVEAMMDLGKPIPTKLLNMAASSLEAASAKYEDAGQHDLGQDMMKRAARIRKYKPGNQRQSAGPKPMTAQDYIKQKGL